VKLVKKKGADHVITCPECRQDVKIVDGDVGKLQPNFWVSNFMTLLRMQDSTSTGKSLICELCDSGDSGVSRCTNCSVFMCEFCVTAHKRINTFKGHKILSLEEVKSVGSQALSKPAFCEKHSGETLKLFCQTCQKTICRDCTIVDHREHTYHFIADVAVKERNAVQAVLQQTKVKQRAVAEGLRAVQTMKSCVQKKVTEVNKQVDCFFDEQVKALEYHRANLKHETTMRGEQKVKQLESQAEMLSLLLAQLKSSIEFADRAIADGDDVKLLSLKKQLIQRLSQLNSSQNQLKPCKDDYVKLLVHQAIWDIGKMASLCCIPFDPQKCTISVVGGEEGVMYQTLAGQSVDFVLIIKDEKGSRVTAGGHAVQAQVVFNSEAVQEEKEILAVQDNHDGSYNFSYCPKGVGLASLSVAVDGQTVHGSPFNWEVNCNPGQECKNQGTGLMSVSAILRATAGKQKFVLSGGKHSWKLQLLSLSSQEQIQLEIGCSSRPVYDRVGHGKSKSRKWCWYHDWNFAKSKSWRSDRQKPFITSVQDNDVFTVFLNFETKILIINNVRSKQAELFTGVTGEQLFPVISSSSNVEIDGDLNVIRETHLSLVVDKPAII